MVEHSVKQGIPKIDKQLTPSINKLALYLTCGKEQKTTTNKRKRQNPSIKSLVLASPM